MPIGGGNTVGTGFVNIKPDTEGFGNELERGLDREGTPAAGRAGQAMSQAMAAAFAGGIALIGKSVFDFANFDKGMREVFTLMPDITEPAMDAMTQQVKDFSTEFGVLPTETIPALYEALGAGVPADNVFAFLETAQKLAKAGVTDLATSVDGLSSVVNAYGTDVISAEKASDIMFETVKLGKGTLDEVAASLFQVTPVAAAFGVSFEEVGASIATLTAQGVPVSVAATQIRSAIGELGKCGTKSANSFEMISGMDFQAWIDTGGTMTGALRLMSDAAAASGGSMVDMFGSIEAGSAALAITKDIQASNLAVQAMGNSAGATEAAFETMNVGLSATMDKLKARFSVSLLNLGEALAPSMLAIGEALAGVLDLLADMPGPLTAGIVLFATLTAGIFAFAKPIMAGIKLFGMLGKAMTLLAANPWMLVAGALVLTAILIVKHWDKVQAFFEGFIAFFKSLWSGFSEDEGTAPERWALKIREVFFDVFNSISDFFSAYWPYLLGIFTGGLGLIVGLVIQNWDAIWGKIQEVTGAIVGAVQTAWNTVWSITTGIGGAVLGFITGIPNAVTTAFSTLANIISAPFKAAFDGIKIAWNATVGGFGFTAPGWIPGVGGNSFTIPSMAVGGVASSPTLALIGDAGRGDPEIVTPQSMMRDTVAEALAEAGGAGGNVIHLHFTVDAGVTDPAFFERQAIEMTRVIQREIERQRRADGNSTRGVAA